MAIAADRLALDLSALPWHAERFSAGFYLGRGNNRKPLLLVAPGPSHAPIGPPLRRWTPGVAAAAGTAYGVNWGSGVILGDYGAPKSPRNPKSTPLTGKREAGGVPEAAGAEVPPRSPQARPPLERRTAPRRHVHLDQPSGRTYSTGPTEYPSDYSARHQALPIRDRRRQFFP